MRAGKHLEHRGVGRSHIRIWETLERDYNPFLSGVRHALRNMSNSGVKSSVGGTVHNKIYKSYAGSFASPLSH